MNAQYRKNLKAIATACKNYTDKRFEDFKWELGTHTIDTTTDSDVAYQKQAPNGTIGCQIESVGGMSYKSENLLVLQDVAETTTNGITYKVENGVITLNGTVSQYTEIAKTAISLPYGTYTINMFNNATLAGRYVVDPNISIILDSTNKSDTITVNFDTTFFKIILNSGTYTNVVIKPMIVSGSTAPTSYKPYFSGIRDSAVTSIVANSTLTIPASIQALAGYGWGINDTCYNYIDFNTKKFVQKVGRLDLGTLGWNYTDADNLSRFYAGIVGAKTPIDTATLGNILLANYENNTWNNFVNETLGKDMAASLRSDGALGIRDLRYTDVASFKTAMSGVYVYYELATPVETDISSYITDNDKFLEVEPLGTITFTNTYEQEVPSEITYLTEVAK